MSYCGIKSLKGLEKVDVYQLCLSGNDFPASELVNLKGKYTGLYLEYCPGIKNLESFEPFFQNDRKHLVILNLRGSPITQADEDYRAKIFKRLPTLVCIDDIDQTGYNYACDEGQFYAEDGKVNEDFIVDRELVDPIEVALEDFGED